MKKKQSEDARAGQHWSQGGLGARSCTEFDDANEHLERQVSADRASSRGGATHLIPHEARLDGAVRTDPLVDRPSKLTVDCPECR